MFRNRLARQFSHSAACAAKKSTEGPSKSLGRLSANLSAGVVGLANVGKSTFFQAITNTTLGNPANYPYATIDAEKSQIVVASPKLDVLQKLYGSEKKVPTNFTIYDIAGLTRNAALGAGLGNKFLADIRMVDGIFHVVRGFRDDEITHIETTVDPVRDLTIVTDELILKDLDFIETAVEKVQKASKRPNVDKAQVQLELDTLDKLSELLYSGMKVVTGEWTDAEVDVINQLNLLTAKPSVILLNVSSEDFVAQSNEFVGAVTGWIQENCPLDQLLLFSASHERSVADGANEESALPEIVSAMRSALGLISFYTCGPKEAHQWTIRDGSTAPEAAAAIHTDLQKTFISATVYKYADLEDEPLPFNESSLKSKGKVHRHGKTYVVEDGDVLVIKAAGGKTR